MPFFHIADGKLHSPGGEEFFSIGLNHIDSAALRTTAGLAVWGTRFGNSQERWLREGVAADLHAWGFNSVGWVQECVHRGCTPFRHSRNFVPEEYHWLSLPYCHMLPFTDVHQWNAKCTYPDVFSDEFADWCDYVARDHCARMADDPLLIGYFYSDCPTWVHVHPGYETRPPWFGPERLETEDGRREFQALAKQYYRVTHDAIRRYDPNHLILGDRLEAKQLVPDELLAAALPYVDVLSFQFFAPVDQILGAFDRWHARTGKPILLADACVPRPRMEGAEGQYGPMLGQLASRDYCVGWHYCGAYLRNSARRRGLRLEDNSVNGPLVEAMAKANHALTAARASGAAT